MLNVIRLRRIVFIAIFVSGVFLIFVNNTNTWFRTNRKFLDVNLSRQTSMSMNCFKNLKDALPNLSTMRPEWKRSIYFLEVSCRSSAIGRITILPRQACAIESAAFNNPDSDIYVLYASRGVIKNEGSLSDYLLEILASYKNVKFLHFDIESFVKGSIVESLYTSNRIQSSKFPLVANSDIFRFLLLHKYGGLYLDLDVIVLRNLENLPSNYIGVQYETIVNCAVMRADDSDVGKKLTKLCLEEIQEHFTGTRWDGTGPLVVTKIMKKMCGVENVLLMPESNCSGVNVFPKNVFYPIRWQEGKKFFEPQKSEDVLNNIMNNSYVVHVWNIVSSSIAASDAPNSIYNTLAKQFCPRIYEQSSKYF